MNRLKTGAELAPTSSSAQVDRRPERGPEKTYRIHVRKDYLSFSAAHFVTFQDGECEALHGHNYRVSITLEAPLDPGGYVIDFTLLKSILRSVLCRLDHKMLIAAENPLLEILECTSEVTVRYRDRRWIFPRGECVLLPLANTTVELLASWIAEQVKPLLPVEFASRLSGLAVEVEETPGQSSTYRERIRGF